MAAPDKARLPPLPLDTADMRGPMPTSNWVIPGKLIAGAYPGSVNSEKHLQIIRDVIQSGVTRFVCLMEEGEAELFEPYDTLAKEIAQEYGRTISFNHFPIQDMGRADDDALMEFIPQLASIVQQHDEVVYVHCWGGHGRTDIVIALLLVVLYNLNVEEALRLTELYHSKREQARLHSPQTSAQMEQVRTVGKRLLSSVAGKNGYISEPSSKLPPLPPDTAVKGPTPTSNWVIPGKLIAGAYPGNIEPEKHRATIKSVIESGVTYFVCLMKVNELERFVPYEDIARQLAHDCGQRIEFQSFPMPDGFIPKDDALMEFIPQLSSIVQQHDEVVYVHCWGGHGRTGIVIALLLVVLYNLNVEEALRLTELYHSKREQARSHSPQTGAQMDQVRRVAQQLTRSI